MESIVQAKRVLEIFKEMSQIPRESGNEKGISDYIVNFAKNLGLEVHQDDQYNVVIKKPASPGYENRPSIILQGHIDMVCVRDHDSNHDFTKDPIANIIEGEWMHADHTTLGADNGMGGAMMLAILEDDSQQHGPMQLLFTTNEETGMDGAFAIKEGQVSGDYLLNLDTEVEHDFTVSCAGGCHVHVNIPLLRENNQPGYDAGLSLTVTGLKGGHSGIEICEQRANANQVLTRVLYDIQQQYPVCYLAQDGVHSVSKSIPNLVETSDNIAIVRENEHTIEVLISIRSSNSNSLEFLAKKMLLLAKTLGVSAERTGGYPAWEYDKGSKLEEQAISLHNEMFDTPANVNAIHAGLECGLLKGVLPNTQMISFGPTIVSPHTPMERVHLPSVENVYVYLKALLAKLQ